MQAFGHFLPNKIKFYLFCIERERLCLHKTICIGVKQGKPLGLAINARGGICPAGRDRTFGGLGVPVNRGNRNTGRGYI